MKNAKHTPGPWVAVVNHTKDGSTAAVVNSEGYSIVSNINGMTDIATPEHVECEANAALIAAAPEVLEALEELMDRCGLSVEQESNTRNVNESIRKCLNAIAKARGEK